MTSYPETANHTSRTVELGRYGTERGEQRVLTGKRGPDEVVHIYDVPVDPAGRMYLVEEGLGSWAEVAALRRDYLRQAECLGDCPMSPRSRRRLVDTGSIEDAIS